MSHSCSSLYYQLYWSFHKCLASFWILFNLFVPCFAWYIIFTSNTCVSNMIREKYFITEYLSARTCFQQARCLLKQEHFVFSLFRYCSRINKPCTFTQQQQWDDAAINNKRIFVDIKRKRINAGLKRSLDADTRK